MKIVEAIYAGGVLRPDGDVGLREHQRVRLIIEPVGAMPDRETALAELRAGIGGMQFFSSGRLPTRDELHDRV